MSRHLQVILIGILLCFAALKFDHASATGAFMLTPPYALAAHYIYQPNGGSSQASANRLDGTGFVKAKPAAPPLLSSSIYGAQAGITFITSEWKFGGLSQGGNITVHAQILNLQISSPVGILAAFQVWLAMEDLNPDGTYSNAQFTKLYSTTTSHASPISLNNSTNWNWINSHLYRTDIFVIAGGAGARSYASSAQANFTLNSIAWGAVTDFPPVTGVYCKDGNKVLYSNPSVLLTVGQPILLQGCLGPSNANSKANITLIDSNGRNYNATPHDGVPIDSAGNFTASIPAPNLPNGLYIVRVKSLTGVDPDGIVDITFGILPTPAPSLQPLLLIPILTGIAAVPILVHRRRMKNASSPVD